MSENRWHCKVARTLIEITNRWGRERGVSVSMHVCVCVSVCVCECVYNREREREKEEANPDHDKSFVLSQVSVRQSTSKLLSVII